MARKRIIFAVVVIGILTLGFSLWHGPQNKPTVKPPYNAHSPETSAVGKVKTVRATVELDPQATDRMRSETFVDPLHGWVVVGHRILATTDGGNTWSKILTLDNGVGGIGIVSAKHWWLLAGKENGGLFTEDSLKITDDGGRTWRDEDIPHVDGIRLGQAQFVDEEHGWIIGTGEEPLIPDSNNTGSGTIHSIMILWSTTDGGRTWSRMDVPTQIADNESEGDCCFSFISPKKGFLLMGTQPGTGIQGKSLYRTLDGGRHWTEVTSIGFHASEPKNGLPGGGYIAGLDFLNDRVGWLTEARGFVCLTTDGGHSWKGLGEYSDVNLHDPHFLDADHGYAIRSDNALMATQDGGVTWKQIYPGLWPSSYLGFKACFFNSEGGVAVGTSTDLGAILTTEDGGFSWRKTGSVPGGDNIADFSFSDPQHGWVIIDTYSDMNTPDHVFRRIIYRTSDGGFSWQEVAQPTGNKNEYAGVSFINDNTGYFFNGWGHLWVTHDGGRTKEVVDDTDSRSHSFQFISATEGWKILDQMLYATADAGHTWHRIPLDFAVDDYDLVTASSAWVIVGHKQLFSTTDGGESWTAYDLGSVNPDHVAFTDAKHGWLVDDHGIRYHTGDGGQIWTEVNPFEH